MTLSLSTKYLIMQKPLIDSWKRILVSLLFIILFQMTNHVLGQDRAIDLQLISSHQVDHHEIEAPNNKKQLKFTQAINPVYWVYQGGLAVYQKHISPQLSTHCVFETSCSRFSRKLIEQHGIVKGIFLTCDRLSKCNRITLSETSRLRLNKNGRIREEASSYTFKK